MAEKNDHNMRGECANLFDRLNATCDKINDRLDDTNKEIAELKVSATRLAMLEGTIQEIKSEVFGEPGNNESGIKNELIKLRSTLQLATWIGGLIATAMIADFMSRFLGLIGK